MPASQLKACRPTALGGRGSRAPHLPTPAPLRLPAGVWGPPDYSSPKAESDFMHGAPLPCCRRGHTHLQPQLRQQRRHCCWNTDAGTTLRPSSLPGPFCPSGFHPHPDRAETAQPAGGVRPPTLMQSYPSPKPEPGGRGRSAPRAETVRINPEATTQGLTLPSRTLASEGKEPMTSCKAPLFSLYRETQQSEAQEAGCGDVGWPWASSPPGVLQAPPDSNHWACFYVI